ncbi:hypothetical protein Tco_0570691 [Tanacetum coccineum]
MSTAAPSGAAAKKHTREEHIESCTTIIWVAFALHAAVKNTNQVSIKQKKLRKYLYLSLDCGVLMIVGVCFLNDIIGYADFIVGLSRFYCGVVTIVEDYRSDGKVRFPWEKTGVEDGEKTNSMEMTKEGDPLDDDDDSVIGEDEAIWALRLFLPYINEFLLKVKVLFSGDPATTMKGMEAKWRANLSGKVFCGLMSSALSGNYKWGTFVVIFTRFAPVKLNCQLNKVVMYDFGPGGRRIVPSVKNLTLQVQ